MISNETEAVQTLGDAIGFGRMMQLAEKLWNETLVRDYGGEKMRGGAHSVGPCGALLVPCPCTKLAKRPNCDWCCGARRVTKRVHKAMMAIPAPRLFASAR